MLYVPRTFLYIFRVHNVWCCEEVSIQTSFKLPQCRQRQRRKDRQRWQCTAFNYASDLIMGQRRMWPFDDRPPTKLSKWWWATGPAGEIQTWCVSDDVWSCESFYERRCCSRLLAVSACWCFRAEAVCAFWTIRSEFSTWERLHPLWQLHRASRYFIRNWHSTHLDRMWLSYVYICKYIYIIYIDVFWYFGFKHPYLSNLGWGKFLLEGLLWMLMFLHPNLRQVVFRDGPSGHARSAARRLVGSRTAVRRCTFCLSPAHDWVFRDLFGVQDPAFGPGSRWRPAYVQREPTSRPLPSWLRSFSNIWMEEAFKAATSSKALQIHPKMFRGI